MYLLIHAHFVSFSWKAKLVEIFLKSTKSRLHCLDCLLKEVLQGWGNSFWVALFFTCHEATLLLNSSSYFINHFCIFLSTKTIL